MILRISRAAQVAAILCAALGLAVPGAQAQIDGHGPDAWRVTGVAQNDVLNVRMGPGTQYLVSGSFSPSERGLEQITCVPLHTPAQYNALTAAQVKALPPRWCLMRNAAMTTAGWVAQRFIMPDDSIAARRPSAASTAKAAPTKTSASNATVVEATAMVRKLYDAQTRADRGQGTSPLQGKMASSYFTSDIVAAQAGSVRILYMAHRISTAVSPALLPIPNNQCCAAWSRSTSISPISANHNAHPFTYAPTPPKAVPRCVSFGSSMMDGPIHS